MNSTRSRWVWVAALALALGSTSFAQTTGEIYGKVADSSGAVVPGVTVTLESPNLMSAQTATTSGTGVYRFPRIPIGTYSVRFELSGFRTVVRKEIRIEMGLNVAINATMDPGAQETVTITGEAPLIDTRDNSRVNRFNQEALQNIPSARDPWVILQQSAGIVMDRENIGGNQSGQQSNFIARGAATSQQKWNLDGVDITDMSATGASPVYYDFDAFEEMQITTGGADVTMQTAGVGVNLITKSGTDKFKGTARYLVTDDKFQSANVTDAIRAQGASSGNPIQNIKDWGAEMGGPVIKGKLWAWASYGTQDIKVGVNNFFIRNSSCDSLVRGSNGAVLGAAALAGVPFESVKSCLNTDLTQLKTWNGKVDYKLAQNTRLSLFYNQALKYRNARGASDLNPIETTNQQRGVADPKLGSSFWKTGTPKTYKASIRHIFSDRFMMEFQYSHVGNNFVLDFNKPELATVQPSFEINSGVWGRSFNASQFVRPTNSFDLTGTKSVSGVFGGDHALKFGVRYRQDRAISTNHRGGNVEARWTDANNDRVFQSSEATQANLYRDSYTDYNLFDEAAYLQDTFTRGRVTIMAGLRFDRQWDRANAGTVGAHPFFGQPTRTGIAFNQLPQISFPGAEGGVTFNDLVPRFGFNYDVNGDGRNVVKFNFARYASQLGDGQTSSTYNPVVATVVRYPWTDLNGDLFVQANEVTISGAPLAFTAGYNPNNPSALTTTGTVDPNLKMDKANELILSFDRQFSNSFAVGIAGIYRKYNSFLWNDTIGLTDADYSPVSFTPTAAQCPVAGAQCQTVTYFQPNFNLATVPNYIYTNRPGYHREYKGVELTFRKRASNGLMVNGSVTVGDTKDFYPKGSYEDPTNIVNLDGAQYAPQSAGSGIDNIFINAKWLTRMQASYTIPWQKIGVAAAYNGRSGYPNPQGILSPTRANGAGTATVYLVPLGDNRLAAYHNIDLRADKTFKVAGNAKITASVDAFNVLNNDSIQSRRRTQNATNANQISSLVAPRVIRFGAKLSW